MNYEVFKKQLLEQLARKQEWGISREQILFYPDGLTAGDDLETLEFIRSTNIRYHKCESDVLMGDYLVITETEEGAAGTGICRFEVKYLYECFQNSGWGLVWENALLNTNIMAPPRIYLTMGECFRAPYERGAFMSVGSKVDRIGFRQIPTLTTTRQTNGAIALFYPGVRERLAQMAGGSYYVAFTSIHEARLHCEGSMPPETILGVIRDVNREFDPAEILTRKVFHYDAGTGIFGPMDL